MGARIVSASHVVLLTIEQSLHFDSLGLQVLSTLFSAFFPHNMHRRFAKVPLWPSLQHNGPLLQSR